MSAIAHELPTTSAYKSKINSHGHASLFLIHRPTALHTYSWLNRCCVGAQLTIGIRCLCPLERNILVSLPVVQRKI